MVAKMKDKFIAKYYQIHFEEIAEYEAEGNDSERLHKGVL
jgi:hypothetical protein